MVRRRSTVRFRKGAPAQARDSNTVISLGGQQGGQREWTSEVCASQTPFWSVSKFLVGREPSRTSGFGWQEALILGISTMVVDLSEIGLGGECHEHEC
jgi:hypothetical protein